MPLRQALKHGAFSSSQSEDVRQIAEYAEMLGPDIHMQTDYGDEVGGLTPWELFDETDAREALTMAEDAVRLATQLVQEVTDE